MTGFWSDFPGITEELELVAARIKEVVRAENGLINDALHSLIEGDGKLLRPGLLLIAARFGKMDPTKRTALAAALELLHAATLVHDDVIDDSPLRRGLPAVHVRYGQKDAVLVGDYLLSRCFLLTASYTTPDNANRLARVISAICTMEIEQDMDRFRANPSIRHYLRKIMGKTALLFSLASHVGATESKAPARVVERLRRAGYDLGMSFQIIDDILDYTGDPLFVRKPVGNDLRAGLATLPLLCALAKDKSGGLRAMVSPKNFPKANVDEIIAETIGGGGVQEAWRYAHRYTERAITEIRRLPAGSPRTMMEKIAEKLLHRKY